MEIDYNILITYGAVVRRLDKGEFVFHEGATPHFFYQVLEGEVKVFCSNNEGKELIQGIFNAGESFGEPPLLLNKPYPSTAKALQPTVLIKIGKENFLAVMKDYPEISQQLLYTFANRIYNKAIAAQIWVSQTPEEKILHFLQIKRTDKNKPALIPYTRQQIADFTGLRVETVIRTLSRMHGEGKVKIINHQLYY